MRLRCLPPPGLVSTRFSSLQLRRVLPLIHNLTRQFSIRSSRCFHTSLLNYRGCTGFKSAPGVQGFSKGVALDDVGRRLLSQLKRSDQDRLRQVERTERLRRDATGRRRQNHTLLLIHSPRFLPLSSSRNIMPASSALLHANILVSDFQDTGTQYSPLYLS